MNNVRNIKGFGMGLYLSRYFASIIGVDLGLVDSNEENRVEFYLKIILDIKKENKPFELRILFWKK